MPGVKNFIAHLLSPLKQKEAEAKQEIKDFKETVLQATGWSERTYYNKIAQPKSIKEKEIDAILKIFDSPHWAERLHLDTTKN